jgi:hypothetical protein
MNEEREKEKQKKSGKIQPEWYARFKILITNYWCAAVYV